MNTDTKNMAIWPKEKIAQLYKWQMGLLIKKIGAFDCINKAGRCPHLSSIGKPATDYLCFNQGNYLMLMSECTGKEETP